MSLSMNYFRYNFFLHFLTIVCFDTYVIHIFIVTSMFYTGYSLAITHVLTP